MKYFVGRPLMHNFFFAWIFFKNQNRFTPLNSYKGYHVCLVNKTHIICPSNDKNLRFLINQTEVMLAKLGHNFDYAQSTSWAQFNDLCFFFFSSFFFVSKDAQCSGTDSWHFLE